MAGDYFPKIVSNHFAVAGSGTFAGPGSPVTYTSTPFAPKLKLIYPQTFKINDSVILTSKDRLWFNEAENIVTTVHIDAEDYSFSITCNESLKAVEEKRKSLEFNKLLEYKKYMDNLKEEEDKIKSWGYFKKSPHYKKKYSDILTPEASAIFWNKFMLGKKKGPNDPR